ncbi:MAG: hypothetical protein RLY78_2952, partial [Pseudomonadota bacterium]
MTPPSLMNPPTPPVPPITAAAPADRPPRGLWRARRFLLLRRACQAGVFLLFLLGPWAGLWIVKGNLASSLTLG